MRKLIVPVLVAMALGSAACGSSSKAAAPSTTTTSSTTSTTVPPTTTTTTPTTTSTTTSSTASQQTITVTPSTGLTSGESVKVVAAGFAPNENLVVSECKNVANPTETDCDIAGVKMVTADSSGKVDTTFTVEKSFSGITCSGPNACIVSVTQVTPNPTQAASAPVTFK